MKAYSADNVFKVLCNTASELIALTANQWQYISLLLSGDDKSLLFSIDAVSTASYSFPTGAFETNEEVETHLGLNAASFKEVKLFSYARRDIHKYVAHTQIEYEKEELVFYYPLDGKKTTRYLLNPLNPEETVKNPLVDTYWIANPHAQLLCPEGYYYEADVGKDLTPICSKQEYLAVSSNISLISVPLNTKKELNKLVGVSAWVYYNKNSITLFTFGSSGQPAISLSSTSTGIQYTVEGFSSVSIKVNYKGWVHIGYTNAKGESEYITKVYFDCKLVQGYSKATPAPHTGTTEVAYTLDLYPKAIVKDLHVFGYEELEEFKGMEDYLYKRVYSYGEGVALAYVPGVTLSADKKLLVFHTEGVVEGEGTVVTGLSDPGNLLSHSSI